MYIKVGEIINLPRLMVVELCREDGCKGCYFENDCDKYKSPQCTPMERDDSRSVIFKEVEKRFRKDIMLVRIDNKKEWKKFLKLAKRKGLKIEVKEPSGYPVAVDTTVISFQWNLDIVSEATAFEDCWRWTPKEEI